MNVMLALNCGRDNGTFTEQEMRNRLDPRHIMSLFLLAYHSCLLFCFSRLQVLSRMVLQP
jgi:hypothetical protein